MAYSSSSTGSVGTSSMGSSVGTTSSTSTGTSGASVGTSASTGMNSSGTNSTNGSTGTPNNTGFTGLSYSNGTWSSNSNSLGTLSLGAPGLSGFVSNNFGTGWSDNGSSSEHTMTVDEVYGKSDTSFGNQSIVENQGDYEASSNEKSNVETSTFGKQDEISVTPVSVTKDEGLVNNDAIQSVEGLNFQQKDKASQEVTEAKKSRDEAEAEDNADGMRAQLKSVAEKDAEETAEEDNNAFQVGDRDEELAKKEAELAKAEKDLNKVNKDLEEAKNAKLEADKKAKEAEQAYQARLQEKEEAEPVIQNLAHAMEGFEDNPIVNFFIKSDLDDLRSHMADIAKKFGIDIGDISKTKPSELKVTSKKIADGVRDVLEGRVKEAENRLTTAQKQQKDLEATQDALISKSKELESRYTEVNQEYKTFKAEYWTNVEKAKAEEAPTTEAPAYKSNIEAARNEINNSKDLSDEQKSEALAVVGNVESAAEAMNEAANDLAANPNDINAAQRYVEETARYNKALKDAKGNKTLKNTDCNKTFVKTVAAANNFDVTLADGTVQSYAEFAAEMATKSPALAKGLYEAKAKEYDKAGHTILAQIERAKANMVTTWLGSKFTFADNQVRNQFNQMVKTDERATYAAYNNVLNDPNATPEQKAEAFGAIQQVNSLGTASAALQATTGFFSGIGDGTSDGVYGTTDPGKLNGYQKAMNTASNLAKIVLGLGVTPGANEAYQNMYYMAGAKVNESGLFTTDFDGDGFTLCQEYGNNAAVDMIAGAGELAAAVALFFNPATFKLGLNLAIDAVQTFFDGLYGVQKEVNKSIKYSNEVLSYFNEAKGIASETGNEEAISTMNNAIKQIEDFQLKSDEVGNLDNWLEGSGSNTTDNGKFNQALSYDEWLKLIEADPVMQEYAKSLNR